MMVAATTAVFADNTVTVTVPSDDSDIGSNTYTAYQIFTGTQELDADDRPIGDIAWGAQATGNEAAIITAVNEVYGSSLVATDGATQATAAATAKVIADNNSDTAKAEALAKKLEDIFRGKTGTALTAGSNTLGIGWYLILDTTVFADGSKDTVMNAAVLQLTRDITVQKKTNKPSIDKKIKHNETGEWDVVGDNQIGDTVEFRLEIPVPDVSHYDSYTYTAYDKLGSELTLNASSVKVYTDAALTQQLTGDFITINTTATSTETFKVAVEIKSANGTVNVAKATTPKLYIGYTAVLNESAKIYTDKQENEAWLKYSNNPDGSGEGETTHKKVYDWSFKIEVDKYDGSDSAKKPIAGAKFVLSETANLTLNPSADGTLSTTELTNTIKLIKVSDTEYRVANGDEAGAVYYFDSVADTNITIKGLDDETDYYLYETKAPTGYNRVTTAVNFKISVTYNNDGSDVTNIAYTNADNGVVEIINNKGSVLPSTGGIGTTIFYIIGVVLLAGAAIILVTRRRMNAE